MEKWFVGGELWNNWMISEWWLWKVYEVFGLKYFKVDIFFNIYIKVNSR